MGLKRYTTFIGPDEIEVVTTSKTLEELGVTLYDDLRCLTLIPISAGIFWADGEATAGVNPSVRFAVSETSRFSRSTTSTAKVRNTVGRSPEAGTRPTSGFANTSFPRVTE
ncbi:hypothetical protein LCGC14_3111850, partial [marine sediment metagenome]